MNIEDVSPFRTPLLWTIGADLSGKVADIVDKALHQEVVVIRHVLCRSASMFNHSIGVELDLKLMFLLLGWLVVRPEYKGVMT